MDVKPGIMHSAQRNLFRRGVLERSSGMPFDVEFYLDDGKRNPKRCSGVIINAWRCIYAIQWS